MFSTLFPSLISASALHQDVAAFYDIPSIALRDILMPRILADPHTQLPKWFRTGEDVAMGDAKVREWGGVPVDLMHVSDGARRCTPRFARATPDARRSLRWDIPSRLA